jgi:hypothetical protein
MVYSMPDGDTTMEYTMPDGDCSYTLDVYDFCEHDGAYNLWAALLHQAIFPVSEITSITKQEFELAAKTEATIMFEDSQGFVYIQYFDNAEHARREMGRIIEQIGKEENQEQAVRNQGVYMRKRLGRKVGNMRASD